MGAATSRKSYTVYNPYCKYSEVQQVELLRHEMIHPSQLILGSITRVLGRLLTDGANMGNDLLLKALREHAGCVPTNDDTLKDLREEVQNAAKIMPGRGQLRHGFTLWREPSEKYFVLHPWEEVSYRPADSKCIPVLTESITSALVSGVLPSVFMDHVQGRLKYIQQ